MQTPKINRVKIRQNLTGSIDLSEKTIIII